jgi:nicotinamidase-related amidase
MEPSIRRDEVVANISTLVGRARAASTPVAWVMHGDDELKHGSDAWQLVSELAVADT